MSSSQYLSDSDISNGPEQSIHSSSFPLQKGDRKVICIVKLYLLIICQTWEDSFPYSWRRERSSTKGLSPVLRVQVYLASEEAIDYRVILGAWLIYWSAWGLLGCVNNYCFLFCAYVPSHQCQPMSNMFWIKKYLRTAIEKNAKGVLPHNWARSKRVYTYNRQHSNLGECLQPMTWSHGFGLWQSFSA